MEEDKHLTKRQRKKLAKREKEEASKKGERIKILKTNVVRVLFFGVLFFGVYKLVQWINTPTVEVVSEPVKITESDWVQGAGEEARVTIIEYSDFQCPACEVYSTLIDRLVDEFQDSVTVAYRHFPLVSIHKNAFDAARAAEAAGRQDKFWEMHDKLFENQDDWAEERNPKEMFLEYAKGLNLDMEKYNNDFQSKEVEEKINENIFQASRLGINSTPTFILNDQKINNPQGYEAFKSLIEKNLNKE